MPRIRLASLAFLCMALMLAAGDWSGAVAHIRGMRWYILNRQVVASTGQMLTLTLYGSGFTGDSVVRWAGDDRPTGFVSSSRLTATIPAADVNTTGAYAVTVYDPAPVPTGTETLPLILRVVESISHVYLPVVSRP